MCSIQHFSSAKRSFKNLQSMIVRIFSIVGSISLFSIEYYINVGFKYKKVKS